MIHVGFTGTSRGMTRAQKDRVWELVRHRQFYFHHGDCVGADAEADAIVRSAPWCYGVVLHPCNIPGKRAYCAVRRPHDVVREEKDPLVRNVDIVTESEVMIAAPNTMHEVIRSGTWTTVRRAREVGRKLVVLFPNGAMIYDGSGW